MALPHALSNTTQMICVSCLLSRCPNIFPQQGIVSFKASVCDEGTSSTLRLWSACTCISLSTGEMALVKRAGLWELGWGKGVEMREQGWRDEDEGRGEERRVEQRGKQCPLCHSMNGTWDRARLKNTISYSEKDYSSNMPPVYAMPLRFQYFCKLLHFVTEIDDMGIS